jgi:V/A-type H+-transporting ATPase subunit I
VAAGLSAILFGFLFGSVFSREDILPALWFHPMERPLVLLGAPLVFGVLLLALGQILSGLEAAWRDGLEAWLWRDAGFLVLYLGVAASFVAPEGWWMALIGLGWFLVGSSVVRGIGGALSAVGELVENGLRLLVNTVSFTRVGAFALAHAGLSSAIVTLADAAGGGPLTWVIMVLGNALIILLEALVVSVQTTRLVLFEFFSRFLRGEGRGFRPLAPPRAVM